MKKELSPATTVVIIVVVVILVLVGGWYFFLRTPPAKSPAEMPHTSATGGGLNKPGTGGTPANSDVN